MERAFALVHRCALKQLRVVLENSNLLLAKESVLAAQLKGNLALYAIDKMSALGEKVERCIGQFRAYPLAALVVASAAVEHVLEVPIVGIYLVEHREHACEHGILAPIEHVSGVGAHLVVARQQKRVQFKLAMACTVIVELVLLCLHNISFGSNKLHI